MSFEVAPGGLLDQPKNNSNEFRESPEMLIDDYNLKFTQTADLNRDWRRRDQKALEYWYKNNEERTELRKSVIQRRYNQARTYEERKKTPILDRLEPEIEQTTFETLPAYFEVQKQLDKVEFEQLDVMKFAQSAFKDYLSRADNKYKVFLNVEEGKRYMSKALHRFTRSYQKKVRIQMQPLLEGKAYKSAVFLTLTLDPKKFRSRYDMWVTIKEEQNRFLTLLFKKLGYRIPYISVAEAHKSGAPHLHFVFLGAKRLMDWRELREAWGLGHIWINRTRDGKKIINPIKYMFKYIYKMVGKTDDFNETTHAFLWLFHVRSYSISRGLVKPLNEIGRGDVALFVMEGMLFGIMETDEELAMIATRLDDLIPVMRESGGGAGERHAER